MQMQEMHDESNDVCLMNDDMNEGHYENSGPMHAKHNKMLLNGKGGC